MNKRIIVLLDLSENSDNLIEYAGKWAKCSDAEILLLHQPVIEAPVLTDAESYSKMRNKAFSRAKFELEAISQKLLLSGLKSSILLTDSSIPDFLRTLSDEPFKSLIFIGIKKSNFIKRLTLGTLTLKVIDSTDTNVIGIPLTVKAKAPGKLYIAVSHENSLNTTALNTLLEYHLPNAGHLEFFHLTKSKDADKNTLEYMNRLALIYSEKYSTDVRLYEKASSATELKSIILNYEEDLLILQKGSRKLSDYLFRNFLTQEIVYRGEISVAILPTIS